MEGLGVHHLWGFCPAIDVASKVLKTNQQIESSGGTINILVAGSADVRHALLSLGNRVNFSKHQINIYLFDTVVVSSIDSILSKNNQAIRC